MLGRNLHAPSRPAIPSLLVPALIAGLLALTACVPMAKKLEDKQISVLAWRVVAQGRDQDLAGELARAFFFGGDTAHYYRMWPALFPVRAASDRRTLYADRDQHDLSPGSVARKEKDGGTNSILYTSSVPASDYYVAYLQEEARIGLLGPDWYRFEFASTVDGKYAVSNETPRIEFRLGEIVYLGTFKFRIVTDENSASGRDVLDIVTDYVPGTADADALAVILEVPRDRIRAVDFFAGYPAARAAFAKPYSSREQ